MRRPVPAQVQNRKEFAPLPAPIRGWVENDNLAANAGNGCSVFENFFPTASSVRLRGGALLKTDIGAPVKSMIPYRSGATNKLFASSATDLYDVSLFPPTATSMWPQLGGGYWSFCQFAIAGAEYLVMVNGADHMMYYDGTDWEPVADTAIVNLGYDAKTQDFVVGRTLTGATSAATAVIVAVHPATSTTGSLKLRGVSGTFADNEVLVGSSAGGTALANGVTSAASAVTITGVSTKELSHVWAHNSRLWFAQGGTTKAWYIDVDQIGGAAESFDLGGLFAEGGSLMFGAVWSSDSGAGFADRNVFVSTEGEVLVYEGVDPADDYRLVGHYLIGRPVSSQTMKAGGDLIIATEDGMVPMSAVVTVDRSALSKASISFAIEPAWRRNHRTNATGLPVQVCKWHAESMALVGWPHRLGKDAFVVNLITGAWAKWTGLDVQCMALHDGNALFGSTNGHICQFDAAGADDGVAYLCKLSWLPLDLGMPGAFKVVNQARATFRSLVPFNPRLSVSPDYGRSFPNPPSSPLDSVSPALWDVGLWDVAQFDDAPDSEARMTVITQWSSIGVGGVALAPQLQVMVGGERKPDAELVAYDLAFQIGGYVV